MKYSTIALALNLAQMAIAAPIVITRQHTAAAVTVTDTYSTSTNIVTAPTVEIFVSNGVTYTFTLTDDESIAQPTTFTSIYNDNVDPVSAATTTLAPSTTSDAAQATSTAEATSTTTAAAETTTSDAAQATSTADATSTTANNNEATTSSQETTALQAPTAIASSIATTSDSDDDSESTTSTSSTSTSTTSTSTSSTSTSTSTSSAQLSSVPSAIVYSPYNNDGSCKDNDSVKSDLELIASTGIKSIRVYGTDCDSISTVLPNALSAGLVVNQGFWIGSSGASSIDDAVSDIISYGEENGWDVFDFITIGNEAVQSGYISVSGLISKISSVKSQLKSAGYSGKVTTSEPPVTFEENPTLCTEADIDFVGINPHSYFDKNSEASTAGSFVKGQVAIVKKICGDLDIVVTETGFPHKGDTNGGNVPSYANQKIAIADILDKLDNEVTILSTYDDYWKQPGEYGIEQSFGSIWLWE